MRWPIINLFVLLMLFPGLASCGTEEGELTPPAEQPSLPDQPPARPDQPTTPDEPDPAPGENDNDDDDTMNNKLHLRVGASVFSVTLKDNATATAFKKLLPLTLNMGELNGNEKFFNLSVQLPEAPSRPGTIREGDLMLFGSNCLVLFYESFSTPYSYTPLGRLDNSSGLADALGSGQVKVVFEIVNN